MKKSSKNCLKIGEKIFENNLIQGPLAGVSCAPFRSLVWQYSRPAFSATEMISCKTLLHQPAYSQRRYISKSKAEGPVSFQLSANHPQELAEATKIVTDAGADLIDLNCGCPVKKIRTQGAGSRLLSTPTKLYDLIKAMKQNTHVPVSIKIRVDGQSDEKFNEEIAKVVTDAGVDFLVVHGRHWTEHYETPCRYDQIQFFVETLKIPVIGNGDVACVATLRKMLETGCAGVMIGRAGVGQPWLIKKLIAELNGDVFIEPSLAEIKSIFISHIESLSELLSSEKVAILEARKLGKYYARPIKNKKEFCVALNNIQDIKQLRQICDLYFCAPSSCPASGEG